MPAVSLNLYDNFRLAMFEGNGINFDAPGGNGIKCAVMAAFTPNQNTQDFWNDISASEISGGGYTAGGNVCSTPSATMDGAGVITIDMGDPATWAQNGGGFSTARRVVFYLDTGTATTSRLIAYSDDFGSDQGNVAGDFTITIDAAGLIGSTR